MYVWIQCLGYCSEKDPGKRQKWTVPRYTHITSVYQGQVYYAQWCYEPCTGYYDVTLRIWLTYLWSVNYILTCLKQLLVRYIFKSAETLRERQDIIA